MFRCWDPSFLEGHDLCSLKSSEVSKRTCLEGGLARAFATTETSNITWRSKPVVLGQTTRNQGLGGSETGYPKTTSDPTRIQGLGGDPSLVQGLGVSEIGYSQDAKLSNKKSGFLGGIQKLGYPKTTSDPTRIQGLGVSPIGYSQRASDPTRNQGLGRGVQK